MKNWRLWSVCIVLLLALGCATAEERQAVGRGAGVGAVGGAVVGLALGAITGDADIAVAGMAAGAVAGAGTGAMYEYDQNRRDRRARMIADSNKSGGQTQAAPVEVADKEGQRHFEDVMGDWDLDVWALGQDGKKISGKGKATGVMVGKSSAKVDCSGITASTGGDPIDGYFTMAYAEGKGFNMEGKFSIQSQKSSFTGEFFPSKDTYNFYPVNNKDGETMTGIIRSNFRIEVRISSPSLWVAETYTMMDGKEVQIQSYRFTK